MNSSSNAGGASGSNEGTGSSGAGGMSGGPQATGKSQGDKPVSDVLDTEPQNLSSVRQATDLALDHLRDSIRSTDDEMLKELGWTREQAEAFLQRWESMQKAARNGSQQQQQAFEQTLRSLGLRKFCEG